ncbi:MAG: hypothetical protein DMG54_08435 [Acidobacteria bacterium]|nr:MAG: hypothetical protein DMG53_17595 [Acidobacteriota bacterium]PYU44652.1 MAG: hypothetical protein DMG54_08435 [Acidobacteriota bacterium]PYU70867.1 MAG: hypothetical protein DMG52_24105 [Acidobacteriota bacterium]
MIRHLSIVTCICLAATGLAATGLAAQLRRPDFSGTWQVDPIRSSKETRLVRWIEPPPTNGWFFSLVPERFTHHEPYLVIVDAHGQRIKMTTDGKEKVNQLSSGLVHRSKTRWDGNELVTEWSIERDGKTSVRGMDRRSLSADGEELIDDRTIAVSFAEQHFRIVWVKNE